MEREGWGNKYKAARGIEKKIIVRRRKQGRHRREKARNFNKDYQFILYLIVRRALRFWNVYVDLFVESFIEAKSSFIIHIY